MKRSKEKWSVAEIANLLGVTETAVRKWKLPGDRKGIEVGLAVDRRLKNLQEMIANQSDSLTTARTRLANAQSEKAEIETERLKGRLFDATTIIRVWTEIGEKIKSKLMALPSKLSLVLSGTSDPLECEELVRRGVIEVLDEMHIDESRYQELMETDVPELETDDMDELEEKHDKAKRTQRK